MKSNASHIELVKDASFDVGYGCIGNTSTETVIGLGEVDFGTDGTNYKATGVEFAHGWGSYDEEKIVVLSAGATAEEAVPFKRNDRDPHLRVTISLNYLPRIWTKETDSPFPPVNRSVADIPCRTRQPAFGEVL
mgnify:CR=1 FL=1